MSAPNSFIIAWTIIIRVIVNKLSSPTENLGCVVDIIVGNFISLTNSLALDDCKRE